MQPFDGAESNDELGGRGGRGRAPGPGGSRETQYRSRPFSDLVDEDKHGFVRRRVCATICGGFRTVVNEADETGVGAGLLLGQFVIYLIMPACTVISVVAFDTDDLRLVGMVVGGAVPLVLNLMLMTCGQLRSRSKQQAPGPVADSDDEGATCCATPGYLFLFPAKSGMIELALCAVLTFAYGALMVYAVHPTTLGYFFSDDRDLASAVPLLIFIGLSGFSLFSQHCPEAAVYRDNDQELDWGSNHYQRATYFILIAAALLACESAGTMLPQAAAEALYASFMIVYALQVLGLLSHPIVTILWAMEQVSIHVLGTTARASDTRLVLSFILNGAFVSIGLILGSASGQTAMLLSMVVLSFLASHNFLLSLGLKKPFKAVNERLKAQRYYASIVFAAPEPSAQSESMPSAKEAARYAVQSLVLAVIIAGLTVLEAESTSGSPDPADATPFVIAAIALTIIQWVISATQRFAVCRVIACRHVQGGGVAVAISTVMRMLITLCLTYAFLKISVAELDAAELRRWEVNQLQSDPSQSSLTAAQRESFYSQAGRLSRAMTGIWIYRAFNRLYHYPLASSLEALVLLADPYPMNKLEALALAAFGLNRLHILANKLIYVAVSILTAITNKKQRFTAQCGCFLLQFTILLPFTLGVILITALLDTATVPFLGFAFFIIGYPKPLRGWSGINPHAANPNDSRSDGHLYQAMMPQLSAQIQDIVGADPFNFGRGSYYFMKNEKMIVLVQVLERGHNYVVFTVKGTELQETTVCHAEENERINQVSEELFEHEKRRPHFAFSLSAIKQINFGVYDDQKVSLAGVIDNPEFELLVKKAYMRVVTMQLKQLFQVRGTTRLFKIYGGGLTERELGDAVRVHDRRWLDHLQFNHHAISFTKERMRTAQSGLNFRNQVSPAGGPDDSREPMTFLERLEAQSRQGGGRPAGDQRSQPTSSPYGGLASPQKLQQAPITTYPTASYHQTGNVQGSLQAPRVQIQPKYQQKGGLLAGLESPTEITRPSRLPPLRQEPGRQDPRFVPQRAGVAAQPISQSAVPGPSEPKKARPRDDLDELEDMLDGLEGGSDDDLDDWLDELAGGAPPRASNEPRRATGSATGKAKLDESGSSSRMTKPNPSSSSAHVFPGAAEGDWDPLAARQNPSQSPFAPGQKVSNASRQARDGKIMRSGFDDNQAAQRLGDKRAGRSSAEHKGAKSGGPTDIEDFVFQSFHLLFGDEFQDMPLKLLSLFKGNLKRTSDNRDFLDTDDEDVLHLKYIVLQSARLAFHFSLESFIMGEMDLPEPEGFEDEIRRYDQEWFLGSEEYLWNSAIERNLPNLERLIQKKDGLYFAHRLRFGQSKESTFNVFQFRREVIRGIWANLNMELLYYTNANDERFSIQAEKDILRNLLVSLAEIPLGYPVFSSGAQSTLF